MMVTIRSFAMLVFSVLFAFSATAQEVSYTVSITQPTTRLVDVTMEIKNAPGETVDVAMPMWTPGGYGSVWFAKNVQELYAEDVSGNRLPTKLVGTSQWQVANVTGDLRVSYKVYVSPRRGYAQLDDVHFRMTGVGTLMYVLGDAPYPAPGRVTLKVDAPEDWVMATGLEEIAPGTYTAPDYDTLVDAPVEAAAELEVLTFDDHGARYEVVIRNPHNLDRETFIAEIRAIVNEQAEMMGGVPFDRYVFLMTGINTRGGGLEHLNSTTISYKRYDEPSSPDYHRLQFIIAHEFFHLWNVKRIRPEILGPFDYSGPQHSKNIYVSEGITDYYGYLTAARSGVWSHDEFYDELATVIETLQKKPGRLITSVEEASWRGWTRHDNPAHTEISFYTKGSLIGLLLDLDIRARTKNSKSLDDVFRYLLAEHGLPKPGFEEDTGFQDAVEIITAEGGGDADFSAFFSAYVAGVEELEYNAYLQHVGLRLDVTEDEKQFKASWQLETTMNGDQFVVSGIEFEGAAYRAGIMTGDVLLMLNDERIVATTLASRLKSLGVGGEARLQVLRDDRLVAVNVTLAEDRPLVYKVVEDEKATRAQNKVRESWLTPYAD